MKIHLFFEEDEGPNMFTDFKTESGYFDLNDLTKHFRHASIDYRSPLRPRFMETIKLLCSDNINLDSHCIQERLKLGDRR